VKSGKIKWKQKKLNKYDKAYLRIATEWGACLIVSVKKVGAIIVKDRMIISDGYNGTPSGFELLRRPGGLNKMGCFTLRQMLF
jgi:dCMP deaminase